MEKQISIVIGASGEIRDIALTEGVTVRDVLNESDLQGYQLSRKGGDVLDPNTNLYTDAMDREKLYATPEDVSVGGGASAPSPTVGFEIITSKIRAFLCKWRYKVYVWLHTVSPPVESAVHKKKEPRLFAPGRLGLLASHLT